MVVLLELLSSRKAEKLNVIIKCKNKMLRGVTTTQSTRKRARQIQDLRNSTSNTYSWG